MYNQTMEPYEPYDGCYGEVTGRNSEGAYLLLDNGQRAFSFGFSSLTPGTKVLCSVKKPASEGKKITVIIESIEEYAPILAS